MPSLFNCSYFTTKSSLSECCCSASFYKLKIRCLLQWSGVMSFISSNSQPLASFTVPQLAPIQFLNHFWIGNNSFFKSFLQEELHNQDIQMQEWQTWTPEVNQEEKDGVMLVRDVSSMHPITSKQAYLKLLMGFLPNYAPSKKRQFILRSKPTSADPTAREYSILEEARFEKLPFCDYFHVKTLWTLQHSDNYNTSTLENTDSLVVAQRDNNKEGKKQKSFLAWLQAETPNVTEQPPVQVSRGTQVKVYVEMQFNKPLLLKEFLRSNTFKELQEVLESWGKAAVRDVQQLGPSVLSIPGQHLDSSQVGFNHHLHVNTEPELSTHCTDVAAVGEKKKGFWDRLPWNKNKKKKNPTKQQELQKE